MKTWFVLTLPILLNGCLWDDKQEAKPTQCFDILQGKDELRPILYSKCTGNTFILTRVLLAKADDKEPEKFTYRWHQLVIDTDEAVLSPSW